MSEIETAHIFLAEIAQYARISQINALKERDRAIRARAIDECAVLMDKLQATYYVDAGHTADERDASVAIRALLATDGHPEPDGGRS